MIESVERLAVSYKSRQGTVVFTILQTIVCLLGSTLGGAASHSPALCVSQTAQNASGVVSQATTVCSELSLVYAPPDRPAQNSIRQDSSGSTGSSLRNSGFAYSFRTQDAAAFHRNSGRYATRNFHWSALSGISLQVLFCTWLT